MSFNVVSTSFNFKFKVRCVSSVAAAISCKVWCVAAACVAPACSCVVNSAVMLICCDKSWAGIAAYGVRVPVLLSAVSLSIESVENSKSSVGRFKDWSTRQ